MKKKITQNELICNQEWFLKTTFQNLAECLNVGELGTTSFEFFKKNYFDLKKKEQKCRMPNISFSRVALAIDLLLFRLSIQKTTVETIVLNCLNHLTNIYFSNFNYSRYIAPAFLELPPIYVLYRKGIIDLAKPQTWSMLPHGDFTPSAAFRLIKNVAPHPYCEYTATMKQSHLLSTLYEFESNVIWNLKGITVEIHRNQKNTRYKICESRSTQIGMGITS